MPSPAKAAERRYLAKTDLAALIGSLREEGYTVLGPRLVEGVVSLRPIASVDELAQGVRDEQSGGRYRLVPGEPDLLFQYTVGADSPKRMFFPPVQTLFGLHVDNGRFVLDEGPPAAPKLAFMGVRPCELAAIQVQDRVFGAHDPGTFRCESNPYYSQTRQSALFIAVNCTRPGGTCFCASMGTGPIARDGYDLALTELRAGFVVEVGSQRGMELLRQLPVREASPAELELAELRLEQARSQMGRSIVTEGLAEALDKSVEHPHWDDVAKRCLGCGNCTMVCPTCFCASIVDTNDLAGRVATRERRWESCFAHQFTYTTSGPVRSTIRARYRHWIRHKLATFVEQFGVSGCVGCGRCITWCPVGIDITEEAKAVQEGVHASAEALDKDFEIFREVRARRREGDGAAAKGVTR